MIVNTPAGKIQAYAQDGNDFPNIHVNVDGETVVAVEYEPNDKEIRIIVWDDLTGEDVSAQIIKLKRSS